MVCPHCQVKGKVKTQPTTLKTGLGGGKVVAGIFTLGLSAITPGIGLSNKRRATEARCDNCKATWTF